jgi:hypothetical protein
MSPECFVTHVPGTYPRQPASRLADPAPGVRSRPRAVAGELVDASGQVVERVAFPGIEDFGLQAHDALQLPNAAQRHLEEPSPVRGSGPAPPLARG